jgi:hypothetical protein
MWQTRSHQKMEGVPRVRPQTRRPHAHRVWGENLDRHRSCFRTLENWDLPLNARIAFESTTGKSKYALRSEPPPCSEHHVTFLVQAGRLWYHQQLHLSRNLSVIVGGMLASIPTSSWTANTPGDR